MGGRGTFAAGNSVAYTYETAGYIDDVKVLKGLGGRHSLPEEAHNSSSYIKLKPDGTFHEIRIYDKDKFLTAEIAYHPEPKLTGNRYESVLHYHLYNRSFSRTDAVELTASHELFKQYSKYFKGVPLYD